MPQGINTPGLEEFPYEDKTSGVPTKEERVLGEDVRGRVGDGPPPTTQETESLRASSSDKWMTSRMGPAAPPIPHWGTAADGDRAGTQHRHPDGADGARPGRASKYGLLAPADPAVDPAAAGTQVSGDIHGATSETEGQVQRATETRDRTVQRALLVCGMLKDNDGEQRPPEWQCAINARSHQGGGRMGGPLTQQRAPTAHSQGPERDPQTWQRAPLACGRGM